MKRNILDNLLASLAALGAALWFGSTIAAHLVGYDIFETGTATLKTMDPLIQMNIIRLSSNVLMLATGAAVVMIPSFFLLCLRQRAQYRKNAYLVMCMLLFVLCVPATVYSHVLGWQLYQSFGDHYSINGLDAERMQSIRVAFVTLMTKHAWMNFVGPCTCATIFLLFIFRPLQREVPA